MEDRAILEHRDGHDAMGDPTWWEITDISRSADWQSAEVNVHDTAGSAEQVIVDLVQALAKLLGSK